jgi:hypothetical protein
VKIQEKKHCVAASLREDARQKNVASPRRCVKTQENIASLRHRVKMQDTRRRCVAAPPREAQNSK